ncbi:TPM domain-containing protein [Bifidobacterium sp. MA2]|uniref:TPM domain-containing protein n=2 Tax=Bifidobacterium santillanense TaxID=2809028 RepID=A0ABS5UN29_9BIFI|nr:TPM domain-containing protein [Bifidobacterium santillanense]
MAVQTGTMTNKITDPQNLLGSNVSAVTDKIKETEETTGVHVRLQYVESFGTDAKPSTWASRALEATNPDPNTVLLAVASGDGNLVVAVSSNSDEWLRDEATVDELSKAATAPLAKQNDQNWSGAAIAMMNEIKQQKQTSTNSRTIRIGVIVMGVVLVLLVIVIVITVVVRRRRGGRKSSGGKTAKGGKASGRTPSSEPSERPGPSEPSEGETTMADLLGAIEKEGASGEKPMTRRELREARKGKRGFPRRK